MRFNQEKAFSNSLPMSDGRPVSKNNIPAAALLFVFSADKALCQKQTKKKPICLILVIYGRGNFHSFCVKNKTNESFLWSILGGVCFTCSPSVCVASLLVVVCLYVALR